MKKNRALLLCVMIAGVLSNCSQIPEGAYYTRGEPESLLTTTEESTIVSLSSKKSLQVLGDAVRKLNPTQATLYCKEKSKVCGKAEALLKKNRVNANRIVSAQKERVELAYMDAQARDCENRYIDNIVNPYNLNHPTFGCSLAANTVQMVSDKRQFLEPRVLGKADARKYVQAVDKQQLPSKSDPEFKPLTTSETLSTSTGR